MATTTRVNLQRHSRNSLVCPLLNIEMTGGKKTMEKQSRRSVPSWIWDFAGQHRPQYVLSVLSAVCGVVCGILPCDGRHHRRSPGWMQGHEHIHKKLSCYGSPVVGALRIS